jgi:serine/threonine-protein kinase
VESQPPEDDDLLLDVARAILEGRDVNWSAVESSIARADRSTLTQLKLVSALATVHRTPSSSSVLEDHAPLGQSAPIGAVWGHLRLLELVGHGRFGDVFRAWDTRLDREVAVKLLRANATSSRSASVVIEEGRLLARVRHPNVVTVYGAERIDARIGIWTEFINGRTLEQILADEETCSPRQAIEIGRQVCQALEAVHGAGLLHRDIKAQNVMRDGSGRIVLMDFGAGAEPLAPHTERTEVAGTPLYLAPEVLEGQPPTVAADVYSVGVLIYHLLTAQYPVNGASLEDIRAAHRTGRRQGLRDRRSDLPADLVTVVEQALAARADTRCPSAQALEQALRHIVEGASPVVRRSRAFWTSAAGIAATIVLVGSALVIKRTTQGGGRPSVPQDAGALASGPAEHQMAMPPMGLRGGAPSFDGRFYSNTDPNENVILIDLTSGAVRPLTHNGDPAEAAEFSVLSPDGRFVAYSWLGKSDHYELRVVNSSGGEPRVLVPAGRAESIMPFEWSRDGTDILCLLYQPGNVEQMALIRVADGQIRIVRDLAAAPQRMSLSPDGRFIVFDLPVEGSPDTLRDIFITDVRTRVTRPLVTGPADDVNPLWTTEGSSVFFLSDRAGTPDAWIVPVSDGVALGDPVLVARNVGRVAPSGFTSTGALYYWLQTGAIDVFTVPLDFPGLASTSAVRLPSKFVGMNSGPAWSPTGEALAYISQRGLMPNMLGADHVVIHETSGREHDLALDLALARVSPEWSPDGRTLLVRGTDRRNRTGVFRLDVRSGHVEPAVVVDVAHMSDVGQFAWWIDGQSIVYRSPRGLAVRDAADHEMWPFEAGRSFDGLRLGRFALAPDGRSLAFSAILIGTDPAVGVLDVMSLDGTPRELTRATYPNQVFLQTWTPDGRELLYTRRDVSRPPPHELWRISVDTAQASDTGIAIPGYTQINAISLSPDARTVAYTGGEARWSLWKMEHFLPGEHR